eukprot:11871762-Ditylum_brightwellii.AAC.1
MDSAYLCLWDPVLQVREGQECVFPSSKQILEDMARISNYSVLKCFMVTSPKKCQISFIPPDTRSTVTEQLEVSKACWEGTPVISNITVEDDDVNEIACEL